VRVRLFAQLTLILNVCIGLAIFLSYVGEFTLPKVFAKCMKDQCRAIAEMLSEMADI